MICIPRRLVTWNCACVQTMGYSQPVNAASNINITMTSHIQHLIKSILPSEPCTSNWLDRKSNTCLANCCRMSSKNRMVNGNSYASEMEWIGMVWYVCILPQVT